jgi:NTE family protein
MALVLAGGNALGALEAGAYQALHEHGLQPDWIVGSSIRAVNGAIIAGNSPERRTDALQAFWSKVAWPTGGGNAPDGLARIMQRLIGQWQAASFGNQAMLVPSPTGIMAEQMNAIGLYDLAPLRGTLERLVDFDLLNEGPVRLTVVTVDLETGDEVLFGSRTDRIGPEHIMASNALVPDFKPVGIDGRLLGDGGLSANLPVDVVRREVDANRLCVAVELFSARRPPCTSFAEAAARRQELLFASQSRWFLEAHARRPALERAPRRGRSHPEGLAAQARGKGRFGGSECAGHQADDDCGGSGSRGRHLVLRLLGSNHQDTLAGRRSQGQGRAAVPRPDRSPAGTKGNSIMTNDINGKVVVITGASSGIGKASAEALAERGAGLVLAARRKKELEDTASACKVKGAEVVTVPTDVAEEAQVQVLARRHRELWPNRRLVQQCRHGRLRPL